MLFLILSISVLYVSVCVNSVFVSQIFVGYSSNHRFHVSQIIVDYSSKHRFHVSQIFVDYSSNRRFQVSQIFAGYGSNQRLYVSVNGVLVSKIVDNVSCSRNQLYTMEVNLNMYNCCSHEVDINCDLKLSHKCYTLHMLKCGIRQYNIKYKQVESSNHHNE